MEESNKVLQEALQVKNTFPISRSFSLRRSMDLSLEQRFNRSISMGSQHGVANSLYCNESMGGRSRGASSSSQDVSNRIRDSISLSRELAEEILDDVDGSIIAQAGDSGYGVSEDLEAENESIENLAMEKGVTLDGSALPLPAESGSHLPTDAILHTSTKDQLHMKQSTPLKENNDKLPSRLDYMSYLIHLSVFGILGVFTRYLLQKLFGPSLLKLTGDDSLLYLDLPSNILGSFLMGWFGVIFKADIRLVSDHLVVGLTTGYLGSVTTFSGWNMKMLDLSARGHWVFAVGGIILDMAIVNESIRFGVESAELLRRILLEQLRKYSRRIKLILKNLRVNTRKRHVSVMVVMLLILGTLWGLSGALAKTKLDSVSNGAVLWLGCLVAPPGVWARWYLAKLNGQGIGRKGYFKWLPIGTLAANVFAACIMAALSTVSKAVNTKRCDIIVSSVQFGFLGCMSTVSTFVAEVFAMRQSGHIVRAVAYMASTIIPSFALGTLIYSIPVWVKHYN